MGAWLAVALLVGCGAAADGRDGATDAGATAIVVTDDTGREVHLPRPAARVVSLVPSATEIIFALGAGDLVVGRTDFDEAPESRHLPSVGGGLDPSLETLLSLRPELVVLWDEAKSPGLRNRLEASGVTTLALRTRDTTDIYRSIGRLGALVGRDAAADSLAASIRDGLAAVQTSVRDRPRRSVFYIVWNDPPMTAGPNTFLAQIIEVAGGRSIFPDVATDWPHVALEEVVRRDPDVIIRPVGERPAHSVQVLREAPGWRDLRAVREDRIRTVPSNLTNRPGPHLVEAARAMRDAIHPELAAEPR